MINNIAKPIMRRFGVEKFVETGVFMGDTMIIVQDWFCEWFGAEFNIGPWTAGKPGHKLGRYQMHEVEINGLYIAEHIAPRWQEQGNVCIYQNDSVSWLTKTFDYGLLTSEDKCFFFLDAHQHESVDPEPLRREIEQVLRLKNQIICIDDWRVPGKHNDLYSSDLIRDLIAPRADCIIETEYPNFHGKYAAFIFPDRKQEELVPKLVDLPLLVEKL